MDTNREMSNVSSPPRVPTVDGLVRVIDEIDRVRSIATAERAVSRPLAASPIGPHIIPRELVLDLWAAGLSDTGIVTEIQRTTTHRFSTRGIYTVVEMGRKLGDPRAVRLR